MGTRRLTLLRHGQAHSIDSCAEDFERTLTKRGVIEAKEMASRLVKRDMVPDLILASPAERAWATASLIAAACELDAKAVRCARELYLATPATVWRLVKAVDAGICHLLVCGHNPGLSLLAARLGPKPQLRDLPTAGLASAVWSAAGWVELEPETAYRSEQDDPESLADFWV